MLFYYKGKYVNWFYRLLKVKALYTSNTFIEPITADIEEINRLFVWKELYYSAIAFLEVLEFHKIVNTFESIFGNTSDASILNIESSCGLCGAHTATMPVKDALKRCDHSFCYYCAQAKITNEGLFNCKICNVQISKVINTAQF